MNYNSLVFRKDMTGTDEYVKWTGITSDLMRSYLYSERVEANGVSSIAFRGQMIPEQQVLSCFNRFFYLYENYLERGYNIERISVQDGTYSLGAFADDYQNCDLNLSDFSSIDPKPLKEKISLSNEMIAIEVYENGSIVTDMKNYVRYFYSNEDVDFLRRFKEFPLDFETVASINAGILKRNQKYEVVDGLETNRLSCNIRRVQQYQFLMNKFCLGYSLRKPKEGERSIFIPEFWYKGRCYIGRHCDNEPEAICEVFKLENRISKEDSIYLFNPTNYHRNQPTCVERYIKGEITELGLLRDTLADVANNPFLILRYNLIDLCRKFCIYIPPFKLDSEGFMTNLYGRRYSDLAKDYIGGVLTREEIATQAVLKD